MTDNLRDRIAAALQAEDERWHGDPFTQPPASYDSLADAVIDALNLKIAVDYMSADGQRRNFMLAGNYTTEKQ